MDAPREAWRAYHRDMLAWYEWQDDVERFRAETLRREAAMEARQDALEDRMESVEEVARLVPELIERLGPQTLTPEPQSIRAALDQWCNASAS